MILIVDCINALKLVDKVFAHWAGHLYSKYNMDDRAEAT